ncbi:MAG: CotS family spore coat protein [Bacillota bacterium]|jgi:CotS family spore coat protein
MDTSEIILILHQWGEIPQEIKMVRGIYRIKTAQGIRCLKKGKKNMNRLLFMIDGIKYVEGRGFSDLAHLLPAQNGKMAVVHQGSYYYLQEWLEGRELDYTNREDMSLAAEALGRFHRASIGFIPRQGYEAKNKLGKWPKKLKAKSEDLRKYLNLANDKDNSSHFDEILREFGSWLLYHAEESIERLNQSHYQDLVDEAKDWGGLVHGDTAARNFIRIGNKVCMIDFDAIALDVFVTDLWRLLRRTLSRGQWEIALADEILGAYNRYVPVEQRHREVLGAFVQFPEIPWRIIKEYYERENKTACQELALTERLKNYLGKHREIDSFIKNFN